MVFGAFCSDASKVVSVDQAGPECNLFGAIHFEALALLNGMQELASLHQSLWCSGVEPSGAASEPMSAQAASLQVLALDLDDF